MGVHADTNVIVVYYIPVLLSIGFDLGLSALIIWANDQIYWKGMHGKEAAAAYVKKKHRYIWLKDNVVPYVYMFTLTIVFMLFLFRYIAPPPGT